MTPREYEELVRRMNQQIILQRRRARFVASGVLGGGGDIPANAMLWDDGTPMLWDDGSYMLWD